MNEVIESVNFIALMSLGVVVLVTLHAVVSLLRRRSKYQVRLALELLVVFTILFFARHEIVNFLFPDNGIDTEVITRSISTVWWLSLAFFVNKLLDGLFWRGMLIREGHRIVPKILTDIIAIFIYCIAGMIILRFVFDKPITALAATSGVVVFVLGYSAKSTLGEVFSGIALNVAPSFSLGDFLKYEGEIGALVEMNWRCVTLKTVDGNHFVIPNSKLAQATVLNVSRPRPDVRIDVAVPLAYSVSTAQANALILSALSEFDKVRDPIAVISEFGEYGIIYFARFWIPSYEPALVNRIKSAIYYKVKRNTQAAFGYNRRCAETRELKAPLISDETFSGVLGHVDLFESLNREQLMQLATHAVRHEFGPPEHIIRQGDKGDSLFVVYQGRVKVFLEEKGEEVELTTLGPGDYFGDMALMTGEVRAATVLALSDVIAFEITKDT